MTSLTFNLTVILIAAPIWFLVVLARADDEFGLDAKLIATAMLILLTLSVAWGIRLNLPWWLYPQRQPD